MQRECVCPLHSFLAFLIQSFDCHLIYLFSATDSSTCTTSNYLSFLGTTCRRSMTSHVSSTLLSIPQPQSLLPIISSRITFFSYPQHSKLTTYASKRPTTRRSVPGSPCQIRFMPRTKPTSSHRPAPPLPPLPTTNSSAPPCAPTRRSYTYTVTAEPVCWRLAFSITKPSRPVYARTSSPPTTAAMPTRRVRRARPG